MAERHELTDGFTFAEFLNGVAASQAGVEKAEHVSAACDFRQEGIAANPGQGDTRTRNCILHVEEAEFWCRELAIRLVETIEEQFLDHGWKVQDLRNAFEAPRAFGRQVELVREFDRSCRFHRADA